MTGRAIPTSVADYLDVPIPYWLRPNGSQFEAAWATDRRDELQDILADAWRNGYRRGIEEANRGRDWH